MNEGRTAYLEARDCLLAIRARIDELTQGRDPAPWYVASPAALPGDNETPNVRQMAIYERANLTFFRAMLTGSLRGWFEDRGERWQIPGWAWADQGGDSRALIVGNDFIHPLAPPEARRWARLPVLVEPDEFAAWLNFDEVMDQAGFPGLPPAFDEAKRPPLVSHQEPPMRPNVSIAHAISWLAFGISLDADTLTTALSCGVLGSDRRNAHRLLEEATERLLTAGTGGLPFIGKYVPTGGDYDIALTEPIEPERLEDFRRFDVCFDGLRYGTGVHQDWPSADVTILEKSFRATTRRYVDVKVQRQGLMALSSCDESDAADRCSEESHRAPLARVGRTPGSGSYARLDAPLLDEMWQHLASGRAVSANGAAQLVATKAVGGGTLESKAARLAKAYRALERNGAK